MFIKICTKCKLAKPEWDFSKRVGVRDGLTSNCNACKNKTTKKWRERHPKLHQKYRRKYLLKNKYNMTEEDYDRLLVQQDYCCAICKTTDPGNRHKSKHFAIDHDHNTGKVRGLLCQNCNHILGKLNDDISILQNAIEYLERRNDTH